MKKDMNKSFARGICLFMSLAMLGSAAGCGNSGSVEAVTESSQDISIDINSEAYESVAQSTAADTSEPEPAPAESESTPPAAPPAEKIDDNGTPIIDYDEFVNSAWKKEQEEKNIGSVSYWDLTNEKVQVQVSNLIIDSNLDELSEEDGLYKAIYFYNLMLHSGDNETKVSTIREHLAPIENIKSLEDLYALYKDPEYDVYNGTLNFRVEPDGSGRNMLFYRPSTFLTNIEDSQLTLSYMSYLGYSDKDAKSILKNAEFVAVMINDYLNSPDTGGTAYFYDQKALDEGGVTVPIISILKEFDAFGYYKGILGPGNFCELINTLYTPENINALRDHYLLCAMLRLTMASGSEVAPAMVNTDDDVLPLYVTSTLFGDILSDEYNKRYVAEESLELAEDLTAEIKDTLRDMIGDADWLSVHGKELAKHKMMIMRESFGGNQDKNYLTGVEMTENVVEDTISILISQRKHYRKQTKKEDDKRELFDIYPFSVDSRYLQKYTLLYITGPVLADPKCLKEAAYEERLAYLGHMIAHELSHTYDSNGISYDYHGYYEPWMTEEETLAYAEIMQKIADFFEGKETEYGLTINGRLVTDETFADIMATKCCLKLLEKQENPDYDLFFRTLSEFNACYYTEEGLKSALQDTHLPAKERINFVLGQFDKFYEVYDIDESSPYFVPEAARLQNIF